MSKTALVISKGCKLSTADRQIVISYPGGDRITVPAEDLAVCMIESQDAVITVPILNLLSDYNVATVFCNNTHQPSSMLLTLHSQCVQSERFAAQLAMTDEICGGLWKEIIEAKIRNQALVLDMLSLDSTKLLDMIKDVENGDKTNCEGRAAKEYWDILFNGEFRRNRYGEPPNQLFNYGYTILRAATARAIMLTGLYPCKGIFHRNRYNDFPLADDLMEPYRPFVDLKVVELIHNGSTTTGQKEKEVLRTIIDMDVNILGQQRGLFSALQATATSLVKSIESDSVQLVFPKVC